MITIVFLNEVYSNQNKRLNLTIKIKSPDHINAKANGWKNAALYRSQILYHKTLTTLGPYKIEEIKWQKKNF